MDNTQSSMKYCKYCGGKIPADAVVCTLCGRQVEEIRLEAQAVPNIIINNANSNVNQNVNSARMGRMKNKQVGRVFVMSLFGRAGRA